MRVKRNADSTLKKMPLRSARCGANIFTDTAAELDGDPYRWLEEEHARQTRLGEKWPTGFIRDLVISGDQFLVHRRSSDAYSLIAGYPWFTDWGRDTMMAMRGLIIATGRQEEARSILSTFIRYLSEGMIPNRFPDAGETPEYNTIDATLWLFVAMYEYVEKFGDPGFARQHYDDLGGILEAHIKGTRYNIHVTPEGLLYGGTPGVQLTWMDAKVDGVVVTPREGCAVEINALWYNALSIYAWLGMLLERDVTAITDRIAAFRQTFQQYFFNDLGYLNDVVIPGRVVDDAIRPNMIYAVSLPFSPLTAEQQRQVLDVVTQHLYTPLGLRSLSPGHPDFKPTYDGDQWQRDHAYHQGTVWAFLWGEYCLARLKVFNYSDEACRWVEREVAALEQHFYQDDGLYAISEVFDGVNPGSGKGCIQQAWSVGMLLLVHLNIKKIA
jgi:predicted glycogen debranching enzyme